MMKNSNVLATLLSVTVALFPIVAAAQPDDGDLWRAVTIDGDEVAVHTAIDRGPQLRMQLHDRRVDAKRAGPHALQARGRPVHEAR